MSAKHPLACIVLAAGKGVRMKSDIAKPLHPVAGRPMIQHVLGAIKPLHPQHTVIVIGQDMTDMAGAVRPHDIAVQPEAKGTGDAVRCALPALGSFEGDILVVFGDTPLVTPETLSALVNRRRETDNPAVVLAGVEYENPPAYGRIICDALGRPQRIVEEKDATPEEKKIRLCNVGVMAVDAKVLPNLLAKLQPNNAKGEFYLTDIVAHARAEGRSCALVVVPADDVAGVNSRAELAAVEAIMQRRLRDRAMAEGVTFQDPNSVWLSWDTQFGYDVTVGPSVWFGPGVVVGDYVEIRAFCHLEGATIEPGALIGPFARLRPGTKIGSEAHVGNFVELKNAKIKDGAKINHLSYISDSMVGEKANIGAGCITVNYDGVAKYRTEIGAGALIGCNSSLVAPLRVGKNARVGAGSVITKEVPPETLAIERGEQRLIEGKGMAYQKARIKKNY